MYFSNSLFSNFFQTPCFQTFIRTLSPSAFIPAMPLRFSGDFPTSFTQNSLPYRSTSPQTTRRLLQNDPSFLKSDPSFTAKQPVVYNKTSRQFDKSHPSRSPTHLSLTIENNHWFYQGFLSRARTHNKSFCFFSVTSVTTHHITHSVSRNKSTIKTSFNKHPSIQLFRSVFTFRFSSFSPNFVLALFPHFPHRVTLVTAKK